MPAPAIPHVSPELARRAAKHFQCLYAEPQTQDDGLEMATNSIGAFTVLNEWRQRRKREGASPARPVPAFKPKRRASSPPSKE